MRATVWRNSRDMTTSSPTVLVLGRPATDFATFARRNAAAWTN